MSFSLSKLFVAFRTDEDLMAQTNAALFVVINTNGEDVVHQKLKPVSNYARRGFANLFENLKWTPKLGPRRRFF